MKHQAIAQALPPSAIGFHKEIEDYAAGFVREFVTLCHHRILLVDGGEIYKISALKARKLDFSGFHTEPNIWICQVSGPRKTRRSHGYLIKDPKDLMDDIAQANPYLELKSMSEETNRSPPTHPL
ncbi:hypothetical protein EGJ51_09195 [Pseudomonas fulva]|nr:DNA-binding domain-containing protein [Pseudomonas fulva]MBA1217959.1 DNA-binding domain-containing protein [Pseudomonas fulva]RRW62977.1 hypothetical protein EGJ51_09195 [Pseudomonas fulva]